MKINLLQFRFALTRLGEVFGLGVPKWATTTSQTPLATAD